ncbi:hypothetical protein EMPG_15821 [Blastomyces silverae]|uniref:Uncharacterized protein n=1 Tax=Blastomyces silverae TaxID=2060906 RepID=A0A0H1BCA3_9EURO|nr:hypothetical protein EMPG_15821 [Blastomyces silverae]
MVFRGLNLRALGRSHLRRFHRQDRSDQIRQIHSIYKTNPCYRRDTAPLATPRLQRTGEHLRPPHRGRRASHPSCRRAH